MRHVIDPQLKLGEVEISDLEFDLTARDEIPHLLRGLQRLYCDDLARFQIFRILTENFGGDTAHDKGRPGMDLWSIFVLAVLRTSCNIDYDKLKDLADNHITLRGFLGIPVSDVSVQFARSTLGENLSKLTPEILDQINVEVVKAGHCFLDEEGESTTLECRVDSFVVETDVEYPTDTGLFADSLRKMVEILGRAQMPGWRQWQYHLQQVHTAKRRAQKARSSRSRDPAQREKGEQRVRDAYQDFIHTAGLILLKVDETQLCPTIAPQIAYYRGHAMALGLQIERRVFQGEKIPHEEKVFSIFEPYTRWIQKGKAGVPFELGLPVSIIEDQHRFILHHRIMLDTETDIQAAVPLVRDTTLLYAQTLESCSFDRGYYSPANATDLPDYAKAVVLPKKGKLSAASRAMENEPDFKAARRRHSQVESAIAALENHGLDRVLDHGLDGFRRYVSLAIVGRNALRLGQLLMAKDREQAKKQAA